MNFLREIHNVLENKTSTSLGILPSDIIAELQYKIRKGSQDLKQRWANALELVHRAYEVVGVQRPTPEMSDAWKQYESLIQYAVQRLAKDRGMTDDWRMSAAMFHESIAPKNKFKITIDLAEQQIVCVEAKNLQEIIDTIGEKLSSEMEMKVSNISESVTQIKFSTFGICKKQTVLIEKL